ncbi:MAG TPA: DUF6627 family protein [Thiobacillus sp.]|nr:DUF6627 family protein [Thiobacillus sp.]
MASPKSRLESIQPGGQVVEFREKGDASNPGTNAPGCATLKVRFAPHVGSLRRPEDQLFEEVSMRFHHLLKKLGSLLLAAALLGAQIAPVQAGMVGTAQVLAAEQGRVDRDELVSLLEREDLQRQLSALGVDVQHAQERVAALTDAEVARINQRVAELPAGGSALGVILFIFIVFIITDALGITDIFAFVRPIN